MKKFAPKGGIITEHNNVPVTLAFIGRTRRSVKSENLSFVGNDNVRVLLRLHDYKFSLFGNSLSVLRIQ